MARRTRSTRRRRSRRGGASEEEKRVLVDAILAAIANAPPDKLEQLRAAVSPIEPPALKAEVADAAKEETPEGGVAEITTSLMKLDDVKLMALKSALESVPKEGGDATEDLEMQKRREQRIAESQARIAAAKQPLGTKMKTAIVSSGKPLRGILNAIVFVLASAVSSSTGGRTRRRRRRA